MYGLFCLTFRLYKGIIQKDINPSLLMLYLKGIMACTLVVAKIVNNLRNPFLSEFFFYKTSNSAQKRTRKGHFHTVPISG